MRIFNYLFYYICYKMIYWYSFLLTILYFIALFIIWLFDSVSILQQMNNAAYVISSEIFEIRSCVFGQYILI